MRLMISFARSDCAEQLSAETRKNAIKAGTTLILARCLFVCSGISLRRIQLEKRFSTLYVIPSAVKRARASPGSPARSAFLRAGVDERAVGARDLAFVGATKQHCRRAAAT